MHCKSVQVQNYSLFSNIKLYKKDAQTFDNSAKKYNNKTK